MKYKAIIFDMDGTIIDSSNIWQKVTRDIIAKYGIKIDLKKLAAIEGQLKGLALHAAAEHIKEIVHVEHDIGMIMQEKQKKAIELMRENLIFIDGFQNFHKRTQEKALKTGIATNADDQTLGVAVSKLELEDFFGEHIYGISQVNNRHKPNPDIFLYTAQKLGVAPEDCVVIEDSHHGVKAAVDAGMFCIGINTGNDKEALKDAHLIIDHYNDICLERLLKEK